jgi:multiple sugar transport system permease protein
LTDGRVALFSISITTVWSLLGFNMILFLAGLQEIPVELYESARIDGAGGRDILLRLTLPMLAPVTSIILSLTLINVVKLFDQIYVMTGGGPGVATLTLVQYMYNQAFQGFNLGYGSALGLVIMAILMALIFFQNRLLGSREAGR